MGLEAHRPGSRARRGALIRRIACRDSDGFCHHPAFRPDDGAHLFRPDLRWRSGLCPAAQGQGEVRPRRTNSARRGLIMADQKHIDDFSGTSTTGHEWDGIRELDTPLPRWWLWTFYATIVFALVYWVFMPSWPGVTGYARGFLGYSSRAAVDASMIQAKQAMAGMRDRLATTSLADIEKSPDLLEFAAAGGRSAFAVNCSQCHGADGGGIKPGSHDPLGLPLALQGAMVGKLVQEDQVVPDV